MASGYVLGEEAIILRTSVEPEQAWVGQRVIVHFDVLGKDGWAHIPNIGNVDVPGAYVMRTESQGTRLQETIGGTSYSGQRYELSLYPQRGGTVEVPMLTVEVTIKEWGLNATETEHQAKFPSWTFTSKVPPGAEDIRELISTTQLTSSQTWEPEPENLKVGDAIKRTVTLRAADVSGMAFAPMRHLEIEGLGIYPGEPTVEDASSRGALTGTRIETVTYVFERSGEIEIPGFVRYWWDVKAGELKRIELSGLALRIAGSPTAESTAVAQLEHQPNTPLRWITLVVAAIAAVLAFRFRGSVMASWASWRMTRSDTEAMYFRRVMRSVRSGDPRATLRETMRWLDRINDDHRPARLDLFLRLYGDTQAREAATRVTRSLLSGGALSSVSALGRGLAAARTRWRQAQRGKRHASAQLPEMNDLKTSAEDDSFGYSWNDGSAFSSC